MKFLFSSSQHKTSNQQHQISFPFFSFPYFLCQVLFPYKPSLLLSHLANSSVSVSSFPTVNYFDFSPIQQVKRYPKCILLSLLSSLFLASRLLPPAPSLRLSARVSVLSASSQSSTMSAVRTASVGGAPKTLATQSGAATLLPRLAILSSSLSLKLLSLPTLSLTVTSGSLRQLLLLLSLFLKPLLQAFPTVNVLLERVSSSLAPTVSEAAARMMPAVRRSPSAPLTLRRPSVTILSALPEPASSSLAQTASAVAARMMPAVRRSLSALPQ
jgi:hypothetical protein